jgi:outer membrane protein TolC
LINKAAIKADYLSANASQLQALYDYQRIVLNAFTEVINRMSMVQNYTKSLEIKRQQLQALEASVDVASKLFQNARVQYIDVLFAQRDLLDARMVFIETKREQLSAIVNTYQALGGGLAPNIYRLPPVLGDPAMVPAPAPEPGKGPELIPAPEPVPLPEPAKKP